MGGQEYEQNDWIVVTRFVRDHRSRGNIVKSGMTEEVARRHAESVRNQASMTEYNVWAMERRDY